MMKSCWSWWRWRYGAALAAQCIFASNEPNCRLTVLCRYPLVWQVRELLDFYKFDGDGTPVVPGSALQALNGERPEIGKDAILNLLAAADEHIPLPVRDLRSINHCFFSSQLNGLAARGLLAF